MEDFRPQGRPAIESKPGHEPNKPVVRGLLGFATALVAVVVLVEVILALFLGMFSQEEKRLEALEPPRFDEAAVAFPAPRVQADPAAQLARMRKDDRDALHSYRWVDRRAGIARIPIERAIDILATSGMPVSSSANAKTQPGTAPSVKPSAAPRADARPDPGRGQKP